MPRNKFNKKLARPMSRKFKNVLKEQNRCN